MIGRLALPVLVLTLSSCQQAKFLVQPSIAKVRAADDDGSRSSCCPVGTRRSERGGLLLGVRHDSGLGLELEHSSTKLPRRRNSYGKTNHDIESEHEALDVRLGHATRWGDSCTSVEILAGVRRSGRKGIDTRSHPSRSGASKVGEDWVDAVVGLGVRQDLVDNLSAHLRADYGGFGLNSERVYRLQAGLTLDLTDTLGIDLQYRLDRYRHRPSFVFPDQHDVDIDGFLLSLTYRF